MNMRPAPPPFPNTPPIPIIPLPAFAGNLPRRYADDMRQLQLGGGTSIRVVRYILV